MRPFRFVVASYNAWKTNRWPEREPALRSFLQHHRPDILCTQEHSAPVQEVIDQELAEHERIDDAFEGWTKESNIYWSKRLFERVDYGAEPIGILEPLRRFFWVRLRIVGTDRTVFVATAHYTWRGNKMEVETYVNPRIKQAQKTVEVINRLVPEDEPLLFMGDLNESRNAIVTLREGGLTDCWRGKGTFSVPTHPALPTATGDPQVLDWQFYRGPIRPMVTEVVDYFKDDVAPSDHKPVVVTYGID